MRVQTCTVNCCPHCNSEIYIYIFSGLNYNLRCGSCRVQIRSVPHPVQIRPCHAELLAVSTHRDWKKLFISCFSVSFFVVVVFLSFFFLKVLFERNPCQRLLICTPDPTRAQKSFEGNKSSSSVCQWAQNHS